MVSKNLKYAHCPPREHPVFVVDKETIDEISTRCRVTPLYEKGVSEHIHHKHYSLSRNKYLSCAWDKYKEGIATKVFTPFQFPNQRDIHFHNCRSRFLPSETDYNRPTFRKSLKPGPGVDRCGQMPIPQELLMKRGAIVKESKDKKKRSSKAEKMKDANKTNIGETADKTEKAKNTEKTETLSNNEKNK